MTIQLFSGSRPATWESSCASAARSSPRSSRASVPRETTTAGRRTPVQKSTGRSRSRNTSGGSRIPSAEAARGSSSASTAPLAGSGSSPFGARRPRPRRTGQRSMRKSPAPMAASPTSHHQKSPTPRNRTVVPAPRVEQRQVLPEPLVGARGEQRDEGRKEDQRIAQRREAEGHPLARFAHAPAPHQRLDEQRGDEGVEDGLRQDVSPRRAFHRAPGTRARSRRARARPAAARPRGAPARAGARAGSARGSPCR